MRSVLHSITIIIPLFLLSIFLSSCSSMGKSMLPSSSAASAATYTLAASPASVNFGSRVLNTTATQHVILVNSGTGALQVQSVDLSGSTAFQVQRLTAAISLQPSQSMDLGID